ncbi:helix-turn-helix transcriptional regulator [Hazenella sp. IB182353]|uniref:PadR family transcriptional regulator n=1 Tax=Polycladospora coralii TaxID=2771432 RepID=UPI00174616DD|nr:helix-turn-helix transcriptional regulator [Polycladospora coralii]MBS7531682.1 helix-turn-helix transcriptional regulator [Polycladospora coralii]
MDKEIMKGSIDILLLTLLQSQDRYGYEIVRMLKEQSQDLYNMSEGTLYPALKRLEKKNWLESYWDNGEVGARRKYYRITEDGRKELKRKLTEWEKVTHLIHVCAEGISKKKTSIVE